MRLGVTFSQITQRTDGVDVSFTDGTQRDYDLVVAAGSAITAQLSDGSAAAAALHVTQSAVSQSLARLEDELKAQLFLRRHRAIVPTAAGDALFAVVAPFVAGLEERVGQIHRARHDLAGTLTALAQLDGRRAGA